MKVYKVFYQDEFEHLDSIEIVKDTALVKYVNEMIIGDSITDDSVRIFYNENGHHPQTESEAVELLELDGYTAEKVSVYK